MPLSSSLIDRHKIPQVQYALLKSLKIKLNLSLMRTAHTGHRYNHITKFDKFVDGCLLVTRIWICMMTHQYFWLEKLMLLSCTTKQKQIKPRLEDDFFFVSWII